MATADAEHDSTFGEQVRRGESEGKITKYEFWEFLWPVQHDGRVMPLDTLAREELGLEREHRRVLRPRVEPCCRIIILARIAEQAGFDSVWFGDHLLYRYESGETRGPWEAWTTLAGLAEATERVAIGPLVAATAFHSPFMLAKQAATVDEISGGRLVLGLGAGWNDTEFAALGAPFDHRVSRFEEAFTIVRTLLASGYIWEENRKQLAYKPLMMVATEGRGVVIGFTADPNFRAYVDGMNLLFLNAVFRGAAHVRQAP